MRSWVVVVATAVALSLAGAGAARAQTLYPGGLTALPGIAGYGANLLVNPGFDTASGTDSTKPAGWTTTPALSLDGTAKRSGTFSYRLTTWLNTSYRNHVTQNVTVAPGTYRASGWIKTSGFGDGVSTGARLRFNGAASDLVGGTRDWTYVEVDNIVVPAAGTYAFLVDQYGIPAPGGQAWYDDLKLEPQRPQPLDVFMLYPNFRGMLFDDQSPDITLDVAVTPPGLPLAATTVVLTLREEVTGIVVAWRRYPAPPAKFTATLNAGAMSASLPYRLGVALRRSSDDALVYAFPDFRVSKVPASRRASMNVAFDAKNRVLLRGVPRFVLGVYDAGGGYSQNDAYWENQIWSLSGNRKLEGLRINVYLNYHLGQMDALSTAALLANLQKRGVSYLQTYNCFDDGPARRIAFSSAQDAYVLDYAGRAGAGGYYTLDECTPEMIPEAFANLQRLKRLDPDSVTFAALYPRDDIGLFREAADLLSTDPYPLYGAEPAGGYPHGNVALDTIRTRTAVKNARPFLTVLQFFQFTSNSRWPTLAEMRAHAYMAIVEGARGLFWWSVGTGALQDAPEPSRTEHLGALKTLVGELADLEDVLLSDPAPSALAGNSNPDVKTLVKVVGGRGYVFAYNSTGAPAATTFTWSATPGVVRVNAESRTLSVAGNAFSDTFGPYAAHVYVVDPTVSPAPAPPASAAPDLVVSALSASPTSVKAGTTFTLSLTIRNQGTAAAGASTARLYLSPRATLDAQATLLGSGPLAGLAAGAGTSGSVPVTIPPSTTTGTRYLIVQVDAGNAVVESEEGNNTRAAQIQVLAP